MIEILFVLFAVIGILIAMFMPKKEKENGSTNMRGSILKILLFLGILAGGFFLWTLGLLVIGMGFVNRGAMFVFWTLLLISLIVLSGAFLFSKIRKLWKWAVSSALI